ncbi:MAG: hypothetical protein ACK5F7_21825, partial [Planctomycetaceae bacterium]
DKDTITAIAQRISDIHQQDNTVLTLNEIRKDTYSHVYGFTKFLCFTMINHTTSSVASRILNPTILRVLGVESHVYLKLLRVAFLLERRHEFPKVEILDLFTEIHKNHFAGELLRNLVARHMYLYHVPFDSQQAVCAKLKIHLMPAVHDRSRKRISK